jgi:hypothetical protein
MSNYAERVQSALTGLGSYAELEALVGNVFGGHPFATSMDLARLRELLPDYLGMSQGFRYVIAAAQKDAFFEAMSENKGVPREIEMMNVVANFLMWDESGAVDLDLSHDKHRLPEILDLSRSHSELLRTDAEKLLGHAIVPRFSPVTRRYLTALYRGLGSCDVVVRCAHMVAFELHAGAMIDALWRTIAAVSNVSREQLRYFALHVGGDDPQEVYHVEVTQNLIERVVPPSQRERFRESFLSAYAIHVDWCKALVERALSQQGEQEGSEVWHHGACHCGGVTFKVLAPRVLDVVRCNCSICDMSGFLSLIVPASKFELLSGEELLTTYQFKTRQAKHTFCRTCGLKAFYRPRSHPEGVSINVRCLDRSTISGIDVSDFDGQNWEESIRELVA